MSALDGRIGVMAAATVLEFEGDPQVTLLDAVRADRAERDAVEVRMLRHVIEYCAAHQVAEDEAATVVEHGRDTGLALAGPGAPRVSEFAVIELAAALGMTVDACRRYVGQVLEVRYRLPLIWRCVATGDLQWWRAGRIAPHTMLLPAAGAGHVDGRLAAVAHKVGVALTERLCQEALDQFDPDEAEARRLAAAEARHVDVPTRDADRTGTVDVTAWVDTADAVDLETAVAQAAAELKAAGSTESLDVRRSTALGVIAHHFLGDALNTGRATGPLVKPRRVVIKVHLRDADTGRCDTTRAPDLGGRVRCVVHPPGHPDHHQAHPRPQPAHPGRRLRGPRPARRPSPPNATAPASTPGAPDPPGAATRTTASPTTAAAPPAPTTSPRCAERIIAPIPTTAGPIGSSRPGAYLWRSPNGHWYHRDGTGTTDLGRLTSV